MKKAARVFVDMAKACKRSELINCLQNSFATFPPHLIFRFRMVITFKAMNGGPQNQNKS